MTWEFNPRSTKRRAVSLLDVLFLSDSVCTGEALLMEVSAPGTRSYPPQII